MRKHTLKVYGTWILMTEIIGGISGWLTRDGTKFFKAAVQKPPLTPPAIVFPIVWAVLYALMGIGAARVYMAPASALRKQSLALFFVQLGFNFFWSILFFNLRRYGVSFFWLLIMWLLIIGMILSFRQVDSKAAKMQIPYFLWVTFAAYLNFGVWRLN